MRSEVMPSTAPAVVMLRHWPEYLMEGALLGLFMVFAGVITTLLEYPGSPLFRALPDADLRRVLNGIGMGLTAIVLIYSPWGQRSGAHFNPAVTLTFWRLKKITTPDALAYIAAQFIGGTLGVWLVALLLHAAFTEPPVSYVVTVPGAQGVGVAFVAELIISALMMSMVLMMTSRARLARYTGVFAGVLVATYIGIEAPLSGMSINPARSFASALPAGQWTAFWIYLTAPVLGMQLAAALVTQRTGCAKLMHTDTQRCIHCGYQPERLMGEKL